MAGVGFQHSVGIELLPSLHGAALKAKEAFDIRSAGDSDQNCEWTDVVFLCADVAHVDWEDAARLVFAQNHCFPWELQDVIAEKSKNLKAGCGLLVSRELPAMESEVEAGNFTFHDGPELECENTYGAVSFKLYVKVR